MQPDFGRITSTADAIPHAAQHSLAGTLDVMSGTRSNATVTPSDEPLVLAVKFREFISSFRMSTKSSLRLDYKESLQRNLLSGRFYLEILWDHIVAFSEDLAAALKHRPVHALALYEAVLQEIAIADGFFHAAMLSSTGLLQNQGGNSTLDITRTASYPTIQIHILRTTNTTKLRDIGLESVSQLLCVPGLVIRVGRTKLRCTKATIQCISCRGIVQIPLGKDVELPRRCLTNGGGTHMLGTSAGARSAPSSNSATMCKPNPYVLLAQSCVYEDVQFLKLQEIPADVPAGEMPRCMSVLLERTLTDRVSAGSYVYVVAVNSLMDSKRTSQRTVGLRTQYLKCVGIWSESALLGTGERGGTSSAFDPGMDPDSGLTDMGNDLNRGGASLSFGAHENGNADQEVLLLQGDENVRSGLRRNPFRSHFLMAAGDHHDDLGDDDLDGDGNLLNKVPITAEQARMGGAQWKPSDVKRFEVFSKRPSVYEEIAASIDPAVYGALDIKKAIACLLFGGTRKRTMDGTLLRGDMNVLLMGDPSTAKSQLLKYAQKVAPIGLYTSGKGGSAAGLTAAVVRGEGGDWWLEAGSLVLADGGVVCIDEFDKMRPQDQVAIHEAMEQQTISLSKANISTVLNARCSILAAANPMFGSFDVTKSDTDQMNFQASILSRFDAIFRVVDVKDFQRDVRIASHVMSLHRQIPSSYGDRSRTRSGTKQATISSNNHSVGGSGLRPVPQSGGARDTTSGSATNVGSSGEATAEPLSTSFLKKYIAYAKTTCSPILTAEATEILSTYFTKIRTESNRAFFAQQKASGKMNNSYRGGGSRGVSQGATSIHISVRQLESLVRITEAIAKMHLQKYATTAHAEEAVRLFQVSTAEANRSGSSLSLVTQSLSPSDLNRVYKVETAIRQCVTVGFGIQASRLIRLLESQGHESRWIKLALYSMNKKGDIELRHQRTIVFRVM